MNIKTLKVLEYFKIIEEVSSFAISSMGQEEIVSLRPSSDLKKIKDALNETSETVKIILKKGRIPLDGLSDITGPLKKAKIGSILSPGELLKIAKTLRTCEHVKDYIKEERKNDSSYPIVGEIIEEITELPGLVKKILKIIISEEEISDHASPELYKIRRQIQQKNIAIKDKLNSMIHSSHFQKYLQEYIVTLRADRYVIPVKQEYRGNVPGLIHDQSSTGATLFIEPMSIVNMNNDLKTLKNREKIEIERILTELTSIIENNYGIISNNLKLLIKLDVIFAKGNHSLHIKGNQPLINQEGYINFKGARHPLIPRDQVIASDIFLGKDFNTLLITGPNTGGKTVALKTIGLLCLMGQTGLHIPVKDGSETTIFTNIFADIGDEQSIEQNLSTFSSHMTNIVNILEGVDEKSLVLFDELGAGTDPTEGAALAMAILDCLHSKKIRTVATTHYSELKTYALGTGGIENASVEFNVETLRPTYVLQIGLPGKSNAFEISKRLGLSEEIIISAKYHISQEKIRFEDMLLEIDRKRKIMEEEKLEATKLRIEVETLKADLNEKERKLEEKKEKTIKDAKEKALDIIKDAKELSKEIIKDLQKLKSKQIDSNDNKNIENARNKLSKLQKNMEVDLDQHSILSQSSNAPKNIKPGDEVLIKSLNQKGFVLSAPNNDGEVQVQAGIMKINVPTSKLSKIKVKEDKKTIQKFISRAANSKTINISPQVDVRGKMTEEAMLEIDKYLDDAYLSNLKKVTIVHGKGTGALRKGAHELLKSHVHVEDFRIGKFNEGGDGATIVTLK